jgi:hypothetical protein
MRLRRAWHGLLHQHRRCLKAMSSSLARPISLLISRLPTHHLIMTALPALSYHTQPLIIILLPSLVLPIYMASLLPAHILSTCSTNKHALLPRMSCLSHHSRVRPAWIFLWRYPLRPLLPRKYHSFDRHAHVPSIQMTRFGCSKAESAN